MAYLIGFAIGALVFWIKGYNKGVRDERSGKCARDLAKFREIAKVLQRDNP